MLCLSCNEMDKPFTASSANSLIAWAALSVLTLCNLVWLLVERENCPADENRSKYGRASYKNVRFILDDSNVPQWWFCDVHTWSPSPEKHYPRSEMRTGTLCSGLCLIFKMGTYYFSRSECKSPHLEAVEKEQLSLLKAWLHKLINSRGWGWMTDCHCEFPCFPSSVVIS